MPPAKPSVRSRPSDDSSAAVDAFMANLEHPFKAEIEAMRQILREADPAIREGIKWKVPSFRTTEYFATTHLRLKDGVGIVFHLGAKVREVADLSIEDPSRLLTWLAKDRAMVTFSDMDDLRRRTPALEQLVLQWIKHV